MSTRHFLYVVLFVLTGCATQTPVTKTPPITVSVPAETERPVLPVKLVKPKLALVLGGGAVRGFAHVGVIKVLEAQGITSDMVVGTSAGSVVAALYAAGYSGFELQKIALGLEENSVGDWMIPDRGFIKGEALQNFINKSVQNKAIENLKKPFAAVAADLQTGEMKVFTRGNTGMAVRASSSIPGLFQPVAISGHDYVDGGLVSPVPVNAARSLGADVIIAVDISGKPKYHKVEGLTDILLQTFGIMGQAISSRELQDADVVIKPNTGLVGPADFTKKHEAILEGEKAAQAALPVIRQKLKAATERLTQSGERR